MSKRSLLLFVVLLTCVVVARPRVMASPAQTADQLCTFETKDAHYATLTSPAEYVGIKWHTATGRAESFQWNQGSTTWFSYPQDPGTVTPMGYYNVLNLKMTRKGLEGTAYSIKGYIAPNVRLPAATFAAIYEGTGTSWFVAHGNLSCVAQK